MMIGVLAMASFPSAALSQLQTDWSRLTAGYTAYKTPEECNSAVVRTRAAILDRTMRDTLSSRVAASTDRLPKEAKAVAQQCVGQIAVDKLHRTQLMPMMWLYLSLDRDKDAEAMVQRLLDSPAADTSDMPMIGDGSDSARKARTHEVAAVNYLNATPARFLAAWSQIEAMESLENVQPTTLVNLYYALYTKANMVGDSTVAQKGAQRILEISQKRMTPDQQRQFVRVLFGIRQFTERTVGLDSLRKGTAPYVAFQRALMQQFSVNDPFLGKNMDTIAGEFRFPAPMIAPVSGKLNLVVVPAGPPLAASETFPMLRRLKRKFAALEVVYVSTTRGLLGDQLVEPSGEAELQRAWVQDSLRMPFTVILEKSSPWYLPEPDRRRMIGITSNIEKYGGRLWLVDKAGTIVYYGRVDKSQEEELARLIAILVKQ